MYLKSLRLENIACFEELDLDFTDENGEPCKWVVLLGENGVGKSHILYSIIGSIWSMGAHEYIRDESYPGKISPDFVVTKDDLWREEKKEISFSKIYYAKGSEIFNFENISREELFRFSMLMTNSSNEGFYLGAYGGYSHASSSQRASSFFVSELDLPQHKDRIISIFGRNEYLTEIDEWFADLDFSILKINDELSKNEFSLKKRLDLESNLNLFEKKMRLSKESLGKILPRSVRFLEVTVDRKVVFLDHGKEVFFENLSTGYKSTIIWIIDLVRRLVESFEMSDPLLASGIVLVDEIDLHLHPRWQRTIVQKIRDTFPNLQFIVTSHSPFVAQDMTEKDKIIVLTRDGDKVTARQEKGFVKGWRADQILTSWLFGLETTRDEEIESLEKERRIGLQRDEENLLTDTERQELDQVTQELEAMRSSDVAPDRQKLEAAAALVMELMSKTL
ncbi:AAA family ATPase [Armatimonas sp.]|uniref:AAA family ATPase n=1 Tax=Armatimonas sp. TaxID=1872638 RepID=UPI00375367AF